MVVFLKGSTSETVLQSEMPRASRVLNRIAGTILDVGVTPMTILHVHTDEGGKVNLEINGEECARQLRSFFMPGHRILVRVDAADVKLTLPRSLRGHNEWVARVVSVEHERDIVTVKIRGQQVTLKSFSTDIGLGRRLRVWDLVTLSIDPDVLRIVPLGTGVRLQRRLLTVCDVSR